MWLTSISQIADASQNFDVSQLGMYVILNLKSSFKNFKYNKEYGEQLLEEQRNLLTNYILSFSNNGLNLKLYLNEEITRIKNVLHESLEIEEIKNDKLMTEKTNKVLGVIDTFREKPLTQDMVKQILKIQNLTHEITK